jgi:transcriptional regulator with XRE-family HTH domain
MFKRGAKMSVYFSEKFKQLRKEKDLTQEQIADIFHVSVKCVSRWETGTNYPDVEMLPHIAIYFKVTLDELLGTEEIRGEEKTKEYIIEIRNLLSAGKTHDAIELARKTIKEYPLNGELQRLLMQSLSAADSEKYKDEIIAICERVLNNDPNNLLFKFELIFQYAEWGMKEEAKKIVYTLPSEAYFTQDMTMKYVVEGEELINDLRLRIVRFTIMLSDFIGLYANKADLNTLEKIECRKAVIQIENLPSAVANCTWIDTAARAHRNAGIAELYCEVGDIDNALEYVENATQDAMRHIEHIYKPDEDGNNYFPESTPRNLPWRLWEDHLMKPQFDIVRNDERFVKCFDLLKANSRELKQ